MKQFLAIEHLPEVKDEPGYYMLKFSAVDWESAEDWVEHYINSFGVDVELCGEVV